MDVLPDLPGCNLSIPAGQPKHLMSRRLHGAGFVAIDMGAICTDYPLMGPQRGVNHRQIGLGAAHQEMNRQGIIPAQRPDLLGSGSTVIIRSVPRCLLHIRSGKILQNPGMAAFAVIIVEI